MGVGFPGGIKGWKVGCSKGTFASPSSSPPHLLTFLHSFFLLFKLFFYYENRSKWLISMTSTLRELLMVIVNTTVVIKCYKTPELKPPLYITPITRFDTPLQYAVKSAIHWVGRERESAKKDLTHLLVHLWVIWGPLEFAILYSIITSFVFTFPFNFSPL